MKKVALLLAGLLVSVCATDTFAKKEKALALQEVRSGVALRSNVTDQSQFPKYPGGEQALIHYFGSNSFVPEEVRSTFEGKLKLKLSFDIAADGTAQNVKVIATDKVELNKADREVISRVQSAVSGLNTWSPAMRNGEAVAAEFSMTLVVNKDSEQPVYNGGLGFVNSFRPIAIPN